MPIVLAAGCALAVLFADSAQALKTYGALVADDALNGLKTIPASALEAVQTGPVVRP